MKKIYSFFAFLILILGISNVKASDMEISQISNTLKKNQYIIKNKAQVVSNNSQIIVTISKHNVVYNYKNGILNYSMSNDLRSLINNKKSSVNSIYTLKSYDESVTSELVGVIEYLYGYRKTSSVDDWIGNQIDLTTYNNLNRYGIYIGLKTFGNEADGVSYLSNFQIDLNGKYRNTLKLIYGYVPTKNNIIKNNQTVNNSTSTNNKPVTNNNTSTNNKNNVNNNTNVNNKVENDEKVDVDKIVEDYEKEHKKEPNYLGLFLLFAGLIGIIIVIILIVNKMNTKSMSKSKKIVSVGEIVIHFTIGFIIYQVIGNFFSQALQTFIEICIENIGFLSANKDIVLIISLFLIILLLQFLATFLSISSIYRNYLIEKNEINSLIVPFGIVFVVISIITAMLNEDYFMTVLIINLIVFSIMLFYIRIKLLHYKKKELKYKTPNDNKNINESINNVSQDNMTQNMNNVNQNDMILNNVSQDNMTQNMNNVNQNDMILNNVSQNNVTSNINNISQSNVTQNTNNVNQNDMIPNNVSQNNMNQYINNASQNNMNQYINNASQNNMNQYINNVSQSNVTSNINNVSQSNVTQNVNNVNQSDNSQQNNFFDIFYSDPNNK